MRGLVPLRRAGTLRTTDVAQAEGVARRHAKARFSKGPGTSVARLFLSPDHFRQVRIAIDDRGDLGRRPRIQLLDAHQCDVLARVCGADLVIDLARAGHDACHHRRASRGCRIVDHGLERTRRQVGNAAHRIGQSQHRLRLHQHHGTTRFAQRLTTQQVEVLRRRGGIRDGHVALGAELQEALESCRRVLRSLSFVAMRQQQHQAVVLVPLCAIRDHELIDDRCRDVREVAELRFPAHQRVRCGGAEAVLEAHHCRLAERAVDDLHRGLRIGHMLQRRVRPARVRIVQHRLAMAERAALHILPREAHMHAILNQ